MSRPNWSVPNQCAATGASSRPGLDQRVVRRERRRGDRDDRPERQDDDRVTVSRRAAAGGRRRRRRSRSQAEPATGRTANAAARPDFESSAGLGTAPSAGPSRHPNPRVDDAVEESISRLTRCRRGPRTVLTPMIAGDRGSPRRVGILPDAGPAVDLLDQDSAGQQGGESQANTVTTWTRPPAAHGAHHVRAGRPLASRP